MDQTPQMYAELVPSPVFSGLYWMDSGVQSCCSPISSPVPCPITFCSLLKPLHGPLALVHHLPCLGLPMDPLASTQVHPPCQDPAGLCPISDGTACTRITLGILSLSPVGNSQPSLLFDSGPCLIGVVGAIHLMDLWQMQNLAKYL